MSKYGFTLSTAKLLLFLSELLRFRRRRVVVARVEEDQGVRTIAAADQKRTDCMRACSQIKEREKTSSYLPPDSSFLASSALRRKLSLPC